MRGDGCGAAGQGLVGLGMPQSSCPPENSPGDTTGLCPGEPGENLEVLRESNSNLGISLCF